MLRSGDSNVELRPVFHTYPPFAAEPYGSRKGLICGRMWQQQVQKQCAHLFTCCGCISTGIHPLRLNPWVRGRTGYMLRSGDSNVELRPVFHTYPPFAAEPLGSRKGWIRGEIRHYTPLSMLLRLKLYTYPPFAAEPHGSRKGWIRPETRPEQPAP